MVAFNSTNYNLAAQKAVHVGNQSVSGSSAIISGSAVTINDTLQLAKIPHGATVVDFFEDHTSSDTANGVDFGFATGVVAGGAGNLSCLIAAGAKATFNRRSVVTAGFGGQGIVISVSDLDPNRYAVLTAKFATGTITSNILINWTCIYRMDGLPG